MKEDGQQQAGERGDLAGMEQDIWRHDLLTGIRDTGV